MSRALLELGLAQRLMARIAARVEPPHVEFSIDPETGVQNARPLATWLPALADAITEVLDRDELPLVLGGDCSVLLGSMLALRRRGRYGLLFIDGHADFYQVDANPTGEAASMDLALATGRGPPLLSNLEGRSPLVQDGDVAVLGFRDGEEQHHFGSQPLPAEILAFDLDTTRRLGAQGAAYAALSHVGAEVDGIFVHVDADCLDDAVMPAVDYRLAGGLPPEELVTLLRAAIASGRVVGLEVTIYNPALDHDGAAGRLLVEVLARGLTPAF